MKPASDNKNTGKPLAIANTQSAQTILSAMALLIVTASILQVLLNQ